MRGRSSRIWKMPDAEFIELVKTSKSKSDILRSFGFSFRGGTARILQKRIDEMCISVTHFRKSTDAATFKNTVPLSKRLTENSVCNNWHLKHRLLVEKILDNICDECQQEPVWNGKPLSLQLDHINGKHTDNIIQNLRILCPNCHSQTSTFGRKVR